MSAPASDLPRLKPFGFQDRYRSLPGRFYARLDPAPARAPQLIAFNAPLAAGIGLDTGGLDDAALAAVFSGAALPGDAEPIAQAYAGHQFGQFVPQLGDGRALLLGELIGPDGQRRDVQLKGAGRTPFSRMGDGRAALGPVLREYIVAEAMAALGVPTTRALAAVLTGEPVIREEVLPGAVLTRVAASHIRVGTFQYFAVRRDTDALERLMIHALERHDAQGLDAQNRALALINGVARRQAKLIAHWLGAGFVHGVMNTDNMTISGETIDYGPCAFLDAYDPAAVFSSIDAQGRYAYGNQPRIAQWNLARLAETLLPLIDADQDRAVHMATEAVEAFGPLFETEWLRVFAAKFGFDDPSAEDQPLIAACLQAMAGGGADFTRAFRALADAAEAEAGIGQLRAAFTAPARWDAVAERWRTRVFAGGRSAGEAARALRAVNPAIIARNHQIEAVIRAGVGGDFKPFHALNAALARPFAIGAEDSPYAAPPGPGERVTRTFCGT